MPRRVRTHTNPLKAFPDLAPPEWSGVFADPSLPLAVEFGSSKGEFLLEHARTLPGMNILGVEVRGALADELREKILAENLRNAWIIRGNIRGRMRDFSPSGHFDRVYALFPDPWPKKRHHKRRLFRPETLEELASIMQPGAEIHILTDHASLREDIAGTFAASPAWRSLDPVPLPAVSGWQAHCERTARPYARFRFARNG